VCDNGTKKSQEMLRCVSREIAVLTDLPPHPNIIQFFGSVAELNGVNIFLELATGGSLSSHLARNGALPPPTVRNFTSQLVNGLDFLHSNGILHRYLHPHRRRTRKKRTRK
jgi:serine/threonine protein kinase